MSRLMPFSGVAVLVFVLLPSAPAQSQSKESGTATEIRVTGPGWWPTKGTAARREYAGPAACAECHTDKVESQKTTPMAHALMTAEAAVPRQVAHGPLGFNIGSYTYQVAQTAKGIFYSVSDGKESLSVPLSWVFGEGQFGQTYVYQQNGNFYESRLSYYSAPQALDFTIGTPRSAGDRLETALGHRMYPKDARLCFGCHSTASTTSNRFDDRQLIPGITCEACHGPGAGHIKEMKLGHVAQASRLIMNPARLGPTDSLEFCGACHRTSVDAALTGITGIATLRFPVRRLERSRCWGTGDARLTCLACHNPHQALVRDAASYDKQCLSCHRSSADAKPSPDHPGMACGAAQTTACVTCHMPKYNIPEMHSTFTDHKISVHREGEPFTD